MKHLKKILILLVVLLFAFCKKEEPNPAVINTNYTDEAYNELLPVASFTSNKVNYTAGDVMVFTSTSSNAHSLRWTLPDGTTSKDTSISYATDPYHGGLSQNIKLEAISKSGLKSDYIVKGYKLANAQGKVTLFSTPFFNATNVSIFIDGISKGMGDFLGTAPSGCEEPGYLVYPLEIGPHVVSYSGIYFGGFFSNSRSFTITPNGCTIVHCN